MDPFGLICTLHLDRDHFRPIPACVCGESVRRCGLVCLDVCYLLFEWQSGKKVRGEMIRVCKEVSDKYPSLTFELKEVARGESFIQYIEVFTTDVEAVVPTGQAVVLPSESISATEKRMIELSKIKHLLTEQEYQQKLAEILAEVPAKKEKKSNKKKKKSKDVDDS